MKRTLACFLLLCLLPIHAFAFNSLDAQDTSSTIYEKSLQTELTSLDTSLSAEEVTDEDAIRAVINLFFSAKEDNFVSDFTIPFNPLFSEDAQDLLYFTDKQFFVKSRFDDVDMDSVDFSITIHNISINGAQAIATVEEAFMFQYIGCDFQSGMWDTYTLSLHKDNGCWRIDTVRSSDEFDSTYYDYGFELEELLVDMLPPTVETT